MRGRTSDGPSEALDDLKDNILEFAKADMATLQAQMRSLQGDVAALAAAIAKAGIGQVEASVRGAFDHAASGMQDGAERAAERGEAAAAEVEALISRNPLMSLLVALGLGFLFGMVVKR